MSNPTAEPWSLSHPSDSGPSERHSGNLVPVVCIQQHPYPLLVWAITPCRFVHSCVTWAWTESHRKANPRVHKIQITVYISVRPHSSHLPCCICVACASSLKCSNRPTLDVLATFALMGRHGIRARADGRERWHTWQVSVPWALTRTCLCRAYRFGRWLLRW